MTGGQAPGRVRSGQGEADPALLDEVIAAAWQAPEVAELDGWKLRYGHGLTGRANSVWARGHDGRLPLEDKIARAEAFYRERGLRPKAQLSPASEPEGLDDELAARGYERSEDVLIEVATTEVHAPDGAWKIGLAAEPDELWLEIWLESRRLSSVETGHALDLLCGSTGETVFARAGEVAVGRVVAHAGWARERGARLCLNVEASNEPALALYEGAGFEPVYPYWYRTLPA
jgi:N-acetylglutamate synthase